MNTRRDHWKKVIWDLTNVTNINSYAEYKAFWISELLWLYYDYNYNIQGRVVQSWVKITRGIVRNVISEMKE